MWQPLYSAHFEGPIIDNVIAIITRDMKPALDYWYAADALPDFVERSIGTERGLEFPMLVIGPRSNFIENVDDGISLIEPQIVEMKLAVVDNSADAAYRKCMKYVRALDAVLRSASFADYFANMTSTNGSYPFGHVVDVRHEYLPLGANEANTTYLKPARLELALTFREL